MPECDYCGDSFEDEDAYLGHLAAEHEGELSRIDQRRVADNTGSDDGVSSATVGFAGLGVVMLLALGLTGYLVVSGGNGDQPSQVGSVHEHGTMNISIDGQQLDLTSPAFSRGDSAFHFHGNERQKYGEYLWHKHARDVTLQYALGTLDVDVNDAGTELSFNGTTYDASNAGTTIEITVNGQPVDPESHEVGGVRDEAAASEGEGQDIAVTVTTEN